MALRAVVCDIGDVLLLRQGDSLEARWERRMGYAPGTLIERLYASDLVAQAYIGRLTEEQVAQRLGALFGMNEAQLREFVYERDHQSRYVVNAELVAYLNALAPRMLLATLSNDWPGGRAYNERHYRLSAVLHAQTMLYSYEEGMMKPDVAIYLLVCSRLGVAPDEAVFIDNLKEALEGARQVGLATVHYCDTAQAIGDLTQLLADDAVRG